MLPLIFALRLYDASIVKDTKVFINTIQLNKTVVYKRPSGILQS